VVDEDYRSYGLTAEIVSCVAEHDPRMLKAAPRRLAFPDVPIPYSRPMEQFGLPNAEAIVAAAQQSIGRKAA
jgi:pyruvate dehydrogenase E1 component beta subunit